MMHPSNDRTFALCDRIRRFSLLATLGALLVLVVAATWPLSTSAGANNQPIDRADHRAVAHVEAVERPDDLPRTVAGRPLIRPGQVQAAVLDTGAAARLAQGLRLRGVVFAGGRHIAYIHVQDEGTVTVEEGHEVIDFTVQAIEADHVLLSLEGVEVQLRH